MTNTRIHVGMLWLALADMVFLLGGVVFAIRVRLGPELSFYGAIHLQGWMVLLGGILIGNYLGGAYNLQYRWSRFNVVAVWLFSLAVGLLLVSFVSYTWLVTALGRGVLAIAVGFYSVLTLAFRLFLLRGIAHNPRLACRVAVLGDGRRFESLRRIVESDRIMPLHRIVACLYPAGAAPPDGVAEFGDGRVIREVCPEEIESVVRELQIQILVMDFVRRRTAAAYALALRPLRFEGLEVLTPASVVERYAGRIPLDMLTVWPDFPDNPETDLLLYGRVKRLFDIAVSLVAALAAAPLMAAIALAIKISEPRLPVFYSQVRVGRFGREFSIYKFRTMRPDAEAETGAVWASAGDLRITRLGGILRRFRLDELPQLFNILAGVMSLVGPRPERPELVRAVLARVPGFDERLNVPPGLTGWAQIHYPYGESVEDAAQKLEYDLFYIKNMSFLLDLRILLSTLRIVLLGKERVV